MEARVKATGEIIEVKVYNREHRLYIRIHGKKAGEIYRAKDLDFNIEDGNTSDYWTRLEHQYAGMAMQSYVSNNVYLREIREMCKEPQEMRDLIADLSILLATTLVQKQKEKEERK